MGGRADRGDGVVFWLKMFNDSSSTSVGISPKTGGDRLIDDFDGESSLLCSVADC